MKLLSEAAIERQSCAAAKKDGWLVYKWVSPQNRGVPDRIFIKAGRVVLIEFKKFGKRPTKLQAHIHAKLSKEGMEVHVVDSVQSCAAILAG